LDKRSKISMACLILIGMSVGSSMAQDGIEENNISINNLSQSELSYLNFSNTVWNMYNEDLRYAGMVLDEFVKEDISSREALMATTSVYILDSITASSVERTSPPEKFLGLHRDTTKAFNYLQGYMVSLAKYYETGNRFYSSSARDSFNLSIQYKEKADKIRLSF